MTLPAALAPFHPHLDDTRGLLTLSLDHGKANEMGSEQLGVFEALCEFIEAQASSASPITCLCTTSSKTSKKGAPIFIAGANVTERVGWDDARIKAHVIRQRTLMQRLRRLPLFHVVIATGATLGWGTEYLLTADWVIALPEASFALPETGLGILPGARGSAELASLIGPAHAIRLGCTGETIDSEEALRIGLVHARLPDSASARAKVDDFAARLRRRSPLAVALYKQAVLDALGRPEHERIELERAAYERCVDSGEAAIGRANFELIVGGGTPAWGRR
jgi:enoyl-CoA hydratase/carnithine racemase